MRKAAFIICFLIAAMQFSYSQLLHSREEIDRLKLYRSTIKTSPLAMLVGPIIFTAEYRFSYEMVLSKKQSFQIGLSYLGKSLYLYLLEKSDSAYQQSNMKFLVRGYRFQFSYKWFPGRDDAPSGLYIGPHFSYSYCKITTKYLNLRDEYLKATYVNYDGIVGYQYIYNKYAFDFFCGLGYRDNAWFEHFNQVNSPMDENDFLGYRGDLKIILGINIGLAQ